jgi:hypothetical protein|tara:strand:+ start:442 stop:642 length:201 start_codon:yes stop_codon:yes gene_type:complete
MSKQISLLQQYAALIKKGLNNWTEEDFAKSRKIYSELCNYFGADKAQQALKETRLHVIKQITKERG